MISMKVKAAPGSWMYGFFRDHLGSLRAALARHMPFARSSANKTTLSQTSHLITWVGWVQGHGMPERLNPQSALHAAL